MNKDWRLGVMDIQTGSMDEQGLPPENFAVFALQRRLFSRSNIGVMLVDKQSLRNDGTETPAAQSDYNRNFCLEYNLASANNLWTGKLLYLKSFSSQSQGNGSVYAGHLQYNSRRWLINGQLENISRDYSAEAGYVPRRGFHHVLTTIGYTFLPVGGPILSHGPTFKSSNFFDYSWGLSDYETTLSYSLTTRRSSVLTGWAGADYVRLLQPFDPTNTGRDKLDAGSVHHWKSWGTKFDSKPQSVFRYGFSSRDGGYYAGGKQLTLAGTIGYRIQPFVSLAAAVNYNDIRLRQPWGRTTFWLIGPRFDVTLTNTLYFTTFVQYNEQQNNMNVNTRVQWRYKPASDFFLVWTDNYLPNYTQPGQDMPGLFSVRNRALVLKWIYWWNF
jgi:hypothetical protein